jgi:hypothetical protein
MPLPGKTITEFLNVDLDLGCELPLQDEIVRFLEPFVIVLNKTDLRISLELNEKYNSVEKTILRFIELIQSMPQRERKLWDSCDYRIMNVGIQGGKQPHEAHFHLSATAVTLLASTQCGVVFTVYGRAGA